MLRKAARTTTTPHGRARSATALFVAKGDPAWRPAVGPIVRWAQEVWWAEPPRGAAAKAMTIEELSEVWDAASRNWPRTWAKSRGALGAAVLSARRIGWHFDGPFAITTDQGIRIPLRETSPALLFKALREAVQRGWQRLIATKLGKDGFVGNRVCPDPARASRRRLGPVGAHSRLSSLSRPFAVAFGRPTEQSKRGM